MSEIKNTETKSTNNELGELTWDSVQKVGMFCLSSLLVVGTFCGCATLVRLVF